jgi:hypothetical protein
MIKKITNKAVTNAKNRHENKLEFKTSDQLKEGLLKICNFNNELI